MQRRTADIHNHVLSAGFVGRLDVGMGSGSLLWWRANWRRVSSPAVPFASALGGMPVTAG